jgi:antirestriction protein ArdC
MKNTNTKTSRPDTYQVITDAIIEAMEKRQVIPWRKTWSYDFLAPMNYFSKHEYRGINAIMCSLTPHATPFFLTLKQVNRLGGKVCKGAKSIPIVFWKTYYKNADGKTISEEEAKTDSSSQKAMFPKYYRVFNIEDTEGIQYDLPVTEIKSEVEPIDYCEKIVSHMTNKPAIFYADRFSPCYIPAKDEVRMPPINCFDNAEEFYLNQFHELIHATGHSSRLNRKEVIAVTKFGSLNYSREELVAEIGAVYLAQIAGINTTDVFDNSIAYLQGWIQAFKDDKKMILVAASRAQKAVDYVVG